MPDPVARHLAARPEPSLGRRALVATAVAIALVLLAAGCGSSRSSSAPDTTATNPTVSIASSGPAPDEPGPYAVGRRTFTVNDPARPDRPLTVDVWYPADAASVATTPLTTYALLPGVQFDSTVAHTEPTLAGGAPFPFVVYSHGSGGWRWVATYFTELLASHGFVVASADHTGNTATDQITGTATSPEQNAINRPADTRAEIDALLARSATPGDPLAGSIDPGRIGIAGHSFGGYTALVTTAGSASAPADPRIKAVLAQAPFTRIIPDATLQADTVPTMVITGTLDTTTPIVTDTTRPWDLITGRPLYRVDVTGMTHLQFTDVCAYPGLLASLPMPAPQVVTDLAEQRAATACTSAYLDIERAHQVTNTFGVAFLERFVAGDTSVEAYLTPAYAATQPDVTFHEKD